MTNRNPDYYLWTLVCFSIGTSIMASVYGRRFFLYVEVGTIVYCLGRYLFARKLMRLERRDAVSCRHPEPRS